MMKGFMRHAERSRKKIPVTKLSTRLIGEYKKAITTLAKPAKHVSQRKRKKYIRQVGGAFPFLLPLLSSAVAAILGAV